MKKKWYRIIAFLLSIFLSTGYLCASCPNMVWGGKLIGFLGAVNRSQLHLFEYKNKWIEVPLQIDPFGSNGRLKFFKGDDWQKYLLQKNDRVIFSEPKGQKAPRGRLPCGSDRALEIDSGLGVSYLIVCPSAYPSSMGIFLPKVKHTPMKRKVSSPEYEYEYGQSNQLVFDKLSVNLGAETLGFSKLAENSDQVIIAKIRNFFDMRFGVEDLEAKIVDERPGPLSLIGRLAFRLNILVFSIDLHLYPEVSFYKDSVFLPMVFHSPVSMRDYLEKDSGLFYSWKTSDSVGFLRSRWRMPLWKASSVNDALSFCGIKNCWFSLLGKVRQGYFALEFNIGKPLVKKGFFPQFFGSRAIVEAIVGQTISDKAGDRQGLFFDVSQLEKGEHIWEFWIRFSDSLTELAQSCGQSNQLRTTMLYRK